jgi:hypothetical protein
MRILKKDPYILSSSPSTPSVSSLSSLLLWTAALRFNAPPTSCAGSARPEAADPATPTTPEAASYPYAGDGGDEDGDNNAGAGGPKVWVFVLLFTLLLLSFLPSAVWHGGR